MTSIEKKKNLIDFIDKEVEDTSISDINKAFKFFNKCLSKSIIECYNKLYSININILDAVNSCSDLVFHVYWSLLSYTNNIRLTIFLSERAVLLFTEFITMSRNPMLNKELKFTPNINDALIFAYKKTIGPLRINKNKISNNKVLNIARTASLDVKLIFKEIIYSIHENKDDYLLVNDNEPKVNIGKITKLYDNTISCLTKQIYNCYTISNCNQNVKISIYNKLIEIFRGKYTDNILKNIQIIRVIFELFAELYNKSLNLNDSIETLDYIYENFEKSNFIDNNIITIDNFHKNIKKKKFYTNLKKTCFSVDI